MKKTYYEELDEKMANVDWENVTPPPSGGNGYVASERRIVVIICAIFLAILAFVRIGQVLNYVGRDRELTFENYKEYVTIEVWAQTSMNPESYAVVVKAKKPISSAEISVDINYLASVSAQTWQTREESFSVGALEKGEEYRYTFSFDQPTICQTSPRVLSIVGRLP